MKRKAFLSWAIIFMACTLSFSQVVQKKLAVPKRIAVPKLSITSLTPNSVTLEIGGTPAQVTVEGSGLEQIISVGIIRNSVPATGVRAKLVETWPASKKLEFEALSGAQVGTDYQLRAVVLVSGKEQNIDLPRETFSLEVVAPAARTLTKAVPATAIPGTRELPAIKKSPLSAAKAPTIASVNPSLVKLEAGGASVNVSISGQNLDLIKEASIIRDGNVIPTSEIAASIKDKPTSTQAVISVQASSQARTSRNYQVRIVYDSQMEDVPPNVVRLEVSRAITAMKGPLKKPPALTKNVPPTFIKIQKPNGGEAWDPEDLLSKTIDWQTDGTTDCLAKIELYKGSTKAMDIAASVANDGSYAWNPPDNLGYGNDYRVKITYLGNPQVTDLSDAGFTIGKSIDIYSPSGGDAWGQNGRYPIQWYKNSDAGSYVKIELFKGNSSYPTKTIASSAPNSGSFSWEVEDIQIGNNYWIKITDTHDPLLGDPPQDQSDYFSITDSKIEVLTPKEGDHLVPGGASPITWIGDPGVYKDVSIILRGGQDVTLASSTQNRNAYDWRIDPYNVRDAGYYRIEVHGLSPAFLNPRIDQSGSFIVAFPVEITAPKSGDIWNLGRSYPITIKALGTVRIDLVKGADQAIVQISTRRIDSLSPVEIQWTVPGTITDGDDYRIKVEYEKLPSFGSFYSAYFSIRKSQ